MGIRKRRTAIVLGILVAAGFLLRIWGTAGVFIRSDDHLQIRQAQAAYTEYFEADLGYPVFYQYVGGYILKAVNALFHFIGAVEKDSLLEWGYHEVALVLRLLSAFYGAVSILLVFFIARKLFGETEGLLSAFFLSFTYFHVLIGHEAILDNQMGFFVLAAFLFIIGIFKEGKTASYLLAGLMTGFAVASKYNAVFLVLTLVSAHVLRTAGKKRILKILFDKNIVLAGATTIFGFVAGNPNVWMSFRSWFANIARYKGILSRQDEWMVDRTFSNLWDFLQYNKFTGAGISVHYALKTALFALLLLGIVRLLVRRRREDVLLLAFPFFTIVLGLGFFAIVRARDHFVLIPFYVIIAALGFLWILKAFEKLRPSRTVAALTAAGLLVLASLPSLTTAADMLRVFGERDTCEYGEDWIYENIPPGSRNIFETYTSFIHTPLTRYAEIFPDRYRLGFQFILGRWLRDRPFDRLRKNARFVHVSNFNPRRFDGFRKYYEQELHFYRRIFGEFTLVKRFAILEMDSKSPTQFIFSTRDYSHRETRLLFPEQLSLIQRERDIFFDDPGGYGKSNLIFLLQGYGRAARTILSPNPIREIVVFAFGDGGETVRVGRKLLTVGPEGCGVLRLSPVRGKRGFIDPAYSVAVRSRDARSVLVKIHFDPLRIGYEFFRLGLWDEAAVRFAEALEDDPDNIDALLLLGESRRKMGQTVEPLSGRDRIRARSVFDLEDRGDWIRRMDKLTGMDVEFLVDSLALHLEAEDLAEDGAIVLDKAYLNGKALLVDREARLDLPFFLPGDYTAEITIQAPDGFPRADFRMISDERASIPAERVFLGESLWRIDIPLRISREAVSLAVGIEGGYLVVDSIRVKPDIRKFFEAKAAVISFSESEMEERRP